MPNSGKDPRLRDPRLLRLALKYTYKWKTRCEALRAKTHCSTGDRCSVHHVIVRAFDGRIQVLRREELPRLKSGTEPFGDGRVKARLQALPPQLPPDLYYVPLDVTTYLGTDASDFAALLFTAPTRVYLLIPSLMREPRWLRDLFVKLRDPATGNHVGLGTSWHLGSGFRLLLAAGMLHQAFVRQRFMVWESIKVYGVDEELVLGGPGLAEMGDTLFVIATRSLQSVQLQVLQAMQQQGSGPPGVAGSGQQGLGQQGLGQQGLGPQSSQQQLRAPLQPSMSSALAPSPFQSPMQLNASHSHAYAPEPTTSLPQPFRRTSCFMGADDGATAPASGTAAAADPATAAAAAAAPSPAAASAVLPSGTSVSTTAAPGAVSTGGLPSACSAVPLDCSYSVRQSDYSQVPQLVAAGSDGAYLGAGSNVPCAAVPAATTATAVSGPLVSAGTCEQEFWTRASRPSVFYRRPGGGDAADGAGVGAGAGGAGGLSAVAWLLQRFFKVVKRDRLQDLRALLESEPWRRYVMSAAEVSFLPPSERWPLTVDLAVVNVSVPVLVELVDRAGCHLNYRALKLLVANWDRLPEHCPGGGEGLLLRYLARGPNPLSVLGACLLAMRAELSSGRNHSTALQSAVSRLKLLQKELLSQVQDSYFRISEEARLEAGMPLLEDILEQPQVMLSGTNTPAPGAGSGKQGGPSAAAAAAGGAAAAPAPFQPMVLSDYSPLRLAFRDHDTQFMSAQLIEGYTRRRWLGPEYCALTSLDGHNRLSGLDPMFVYTITENLGFVGEAGSASMAATMRLWHLVTMTSPAFFRSPRGRWAMKFMSTAVFLGLYMAVLSSYREVRLPYSEGGGAWRALHTFFLVFTAGNVLEGAEVMAMRYRNSAGRYFSHAPGEVLGVLVDVGILAAVTPCLVAAYADNAGGGGGGGPSRLSRDQWTMLRLTLSTLAIFVWMRSLLIMVPLYRKLGPLIRTMMRMGGEILAFVPLYVSATLGFAAALHSIIGDEVEKYGTFVAAVLHLFEATLGTFDFDAFDMLDHRQRLYAQILLTVYLVLAAILLTNLLIAIISYKYRPEEVRSESVFDLAEMVDRYRFQVKHNLICSPFNLLLLVFAWMPAAPMPKLPPYEWVKYGLTPLDGLTFATPRHPTTPGGRHEIPHLCYLLTLYPVLIIVANVLYYLHAPYAVLYWALIGHRKLLRELLGGSSSSGTVDGGGGGGGGALSMKILSGAASLPTGVSEKGKGGGGIGGGGTAGGASSPASGLHPPRLSYDAVLLERGAVGTGGGSAGPPGTPPLQRSSLTLSHTGPQPSSTQASPRNAHELTATSAEKHQPQPGQPAARPPRRGDSRPGRELLLLALQEQPNAGAAGVGSASGAALHRLAPPPDAAAASSVSGRGVGGGGAGGGWARSGSGRWPVSATSIPEESALSVSSAATTTAAVDTERATPGAGGLQQQQQQQQQQPQRRQPGAVAEKAERVGASAAGTDVEALPLSPKARRGTNGGGGGGSGGGGGGGGGGVQGLRARSLRSMHSYLLRGDPGSTSGRNMSGRQDELSLYDDVSDSTAVQPPYMALLRLATLSGLLDALLSALRFVLLVFVGTLLYVFLMGMLAGTLGCCLTGWLGSVGVSLYRIVAGAWIGAQSGEEAAEVGSGSGEGNGQSMDASRGAPTVGTANGAGPGASTTASGGASAGSNAMRWISLAQKVRSRATRSTYLSKAQVEAAIRNVYTATSVVSAWGLSVGQGLTTRPAAAAGRSSGGGGGGGGGSWAAASKMHHGLFLDGGDAKDGDGGCERGGGALNGNNSAARLLFAPAAPPRVASPQVVASALPTGAAQSSSPLQRLQGGSIPVMPSPQTPADLLPEVLDLAALELEVHAGGSGADGRSQRAQPTPAGHTTAVSEQRECAAAGVESPLPAAACRRATDATHGSFHMTLAGMTAAAGDAGGAEERSSAGLLHLPVPRVLSVGARGPAGSARTASGSYRTSVPQSPVSVGATKGEQLLPSPLGMGLGNMPGAPGASRDVAAGGAVPGGVVPSGSAGGFTIPGCVDSLSGQNVVAAGSAAAAAAAVQGRAARGAESGVPEAEAARADELAAMRAQMAALTEAVQQLASAVGHDAGGGRGLAGKGKGAGYGMF